MEIVAITGLIILLGIREYLSFKERKDLYNRIMTKSVDDYIAVTQPAEETEEEENEDDGLTGIFADGMDEEIKDEIIYGGQEN